MPQKSALGQGLRRELEDGNAKLSADESILLALRLGERDLQIFMSASGLGREEALAQLRANKHKGRRPSCANG